MLIVMQLIGNSYIKRLADYAVHHRNNWRIYRAVFEQLYPSDPLKCGKSPGESNEQNGFDVKAMCGNLDQMTLHGMALQLIMLLVCETG